MTKMIALLTVLTVAAGTAACAGPPSTVSSAPSSPSITSTDAGAKIRGGGLDATNPKVPGATGRTIVWGDPSTIAGDAQATRMQQTGSITPSN
jgi:hypothetical protein